MNRLVGAIVAVIAILGMKFYNKASAHDDVQSRLVELCGGDAACQGAVQAHYDACFDSAYKMGGKNRSSKLDLNVLVRCVNDRAGEEYFTVSEENKQP
jgi:hypothetical protein